MEKPGMPRAAAEDAGVRGDVTPAGGDAAHRQMQRVVGKRRKWWAKRRNLPVVIAFVFVAILLAATVVPISFIYRSETAIRYVTGFALADGYRAINQTPPANYLTFSMKLTNFDLNAGVGTVTINKITPYGKYAVGGSAFIAENIEIFVNGNQFALTPGMPARDIESPMTFSGGRIALYPFDQHTASLSIYAISSKDRSAMISAMSGQGGGASSNPFVPLQFDVYGGVQSLVVNATLDRDLATAGLVELDVIVSRSILTQFFSIMIVFFMWVVSLTIFSVAVDIAWNKRDVPPPFLALNGSMLFALPALRNSQPSIGHIGTIGDVVGFFWNITLVSASFAIMSLHWIRMAWPQTAQKKGGI